MREERVETQIRLARRWKHALRNRNQRAAELGLLHVFQHHALAALLSYHALVVRQIVRRSLHPVLSIACRKDFVHHPDRRLSSKPRIPVLTTHPQTILPLPHVI